MSYQGSPYSFHIQDDYDMDDDAYDDLDDYRDQDDPHPPTLDDSDEGNHACSISSLLSPHNITYTSNYFSIFYYLQEQLY